MTKVGIERINKKKILPPLILEAELEYTIVNEARSDQYSRHFDGRLR